MMRASQPRMVRLLELELTTVSATATRGKTAFDMRSDLVFVLLRRMKGDYAELTFTRHRCVSIL